MKVPRLPGYTFLRWFILAGIFILPLFSLSAKAQGRVLINEYLAWPGNGCSVTSEFIELYNYGPGPVDISCYIVTDGDYSITIPSNTILNPGQYFVLAGQDVIKAGCANISRDVVADLNWNSCNCTSGAIPKTGDGFLTDGGSAGEQVVLMDNNLNIIDAIARVPEPSSRIQTKATGSCSPRVFDLDDRSIRYEIVGESQGRGNSFARKVNGACGWEKDTQQSGGAANNTKGYIPQFYPDITVVQPLSCDEKGYAVVHILNADYTKVFPMRYTLSRDVDSNYVYDNKDEYRSGYDSTAPNIELNNLEAGLYRVLVETLDGCDLQSLDFNILDCNASLLASPFRLFRLRRISGTTQLEWMLNEDMLFTKVEVQKGLPGKAFSTIQTLIENNISYRGSFGEENAEAGTQFRLKITDKSGKQYYSAVLHSGIETGMKEHLKVVPRGNSNLMVEIQSAFRKNSSLRIMDATGRMIVQKSLQLSKGKNLFYLSPSNMNAGIFLLQWLDNSSGKISTVRFYNSTN